MKGRALCPGEALEPMGERGLRALGVLSQLVTAVPKVRDLPGFKSGETKALHLALLVGFASCWGLFIVYSAFAA